MFPLSKISPASPVFPLSKILRLIIIGLALMSFHHTAQAAGTLIPAPARVDMVYDSARDTVYVTSGSSVLRYQLGANSFLTPFELGGNLGGIDLSPDGNTLAVADRLRSATEVWIHIVDLQTGLSQKVTFPRASNEGGTFTVAFGNDGAVLITSTFEGSGWVPLRRYDPATGATSQIASSVRQDTMLTSSADRGVIGFAESNSSDGPFGRYRVADGNLLRKSGYTNGTSWFNYEMGVNRNGTQYAIPTYGGTYIFDGNLSRIRIFGQYAGPQPIGVVYHPAENICYFAWTGSTEVRAFDTTSFVQQAAYNFEHSFTHPGNHAFQQGRLKISRDGSLLLATVNGGVRYLRLYEPLLADEQSVVTDEDSSFPITFTGRVGNGGALAYSIAANPSHGTLSGTSPNVVYTPDADYNGPDSFTFKATYGAASALATVSITVNPVNDPPVALSQTVTASEDTATSIYLSGSDIDGDGLSYEIMSSPQHGSLGGVSSSDLVYTPAPNYNGNDSFTFKVSDGLMDSTATVTIAVEAVNDLPVADSQIVTTSEDTAKAITLSGTDIENDALSFVVVSGPAHGSLNGAGPNLVYTPAANYNGSDSFTFKANDGAADSSEATVTLVVDPVNDVPVANNQSVTTNEDTAGALTLSGSDIENDALSYVVVSGPAHGTLSGTSSSDLVYTPAPDYNGNDSFIFKANDGVADSSEATVTITVAAVNDLPLAGNQSVTTNEDTATAITLSGSDIENSALSYVIVSGPAHGTLSGTGPNLVYTPAANYNGGDSFTFKVNDGTADSGEASVTILVAAVNDLPVANGQSVTTNEDTAKSITLSGSDIENSALSYFIVSSPAHGSLSGTGQHLVYTPTANYNGSDSFTFKVNDGASDSSVAAVTIAVGAVNDLPVANGQSVTTNEDTAKNITLSGSDIENSALSYIIVSGPAHGTLSGSGKHRVYTPAVNYNGGDSFTFKVNDGTSYSSVATVTIAIAPVNDAPVAVADSATTWKNISVNISVRANDQDVDGDVLTVITVSQCTKGGTVTINSGGTGVTFKPRLNFTGVDTFTYKVSDGRGGTATATVTVTVKK